MKKTTPNILITGAAGFLGGRLSKHLANLNQEYQVISTSRRSTRTLELQEAGCKFIKGDLTDKMFCHDITRNIDSVVHCAALSSPWGKYPHFYQSNVEATKNLLDAAIANHVKQFIFISTPSIYFDYTDRYDVKESDLLPEKQVNHYAITKLLAEEYVLSKNFRGIKTLALRPRAIIGAEDNVIFPRLIRAYKEGKLKIIGNGKNTGDLTSVSNVIEAILCALKADDQAMGKAYNISDGAPVLLWPTINRLLLDLGHQPVSKKIPLSVALAFAGMIEFFYKYFYRDQEPGITKYGIGVLAKSLTMDIRKARSLLNYTPVQTTEEGIKEFIEWYRKIQ